MTTFNPTNVESEIRVNSNRSLLKNDFKDVSRDGVTKDSAFSSAGETAPVLCLSIHQIILGA